MAWSLACDTFDTYCVSVAIELKSFISNTVAYCTLHTVLLSVCTMVHITSIVRNMYVRMY